MATKSLIVKLFGDDKTLSKSFRDAANNAERAGAAMRKVGQVAALGFAAAGAAAIAFGASSVRAFAEAQKSQNELSFAFAKFPALSDTSLESLQRLNSELAKKTRFDDDATASGQAVLAQFGLTGDQLKRLTPLLQDYAARTGKALPDAAEDLGKALLGQGRALKTIGLDFDDTGTLAGNFDQVMQGLSVSVGGFAEKDAETAAGKLEMLKNRFGEVQESIGAALLPSLLLLMDTFEDDVFPAIEGFAGWFATDGVAGIQGFVGWITEFKDILGPAAAALGTLTVAQYALNVAMAANPVGLVIAGLAALVVAGVFLATNWTAVTDGFVAATNWMVSTSVANINNLIGVLQGLLNPFNSILAAINALTGTNFAQIRLPTLATPQFAVNPAGAPGGRRGGRASIPAFAEGGIVKGGRGGVIGLIGEGPNDELIQPLPTGGVNLGGGAPINVYITDSVIANEDELAKKIVRVVQNAQRRGQISRGSFA